MGKLVKIFIMLIAFFLDLWVWNFHSNTLLGQILFIIIFLASPLCWSLVMDARGEVAKPLEGKTSFSIYIRRYAPHLAGVSLLLLVLSIEILPRAPINLILVNYLEIILYTGVFGFLWNLALRDLVFGE
jgi:hypothetical protein